MAAEQYVMGATYVVTGPVFKNVIDTPHPVKEEYIGKTMDNVHHIFRPIGGDFHYIHPNEISSGKYIIEPDQAGGRRKHRSRKSRSICRSRGRRHRRSIRRNRQ
jgi:hypothetical protein